MLQRDVDLLLFKQVTFFGQILEEDLLLFLAKTPAPEVQIEWVEDEE